jgi:undecaprenyl-diphosphatase
MTTAASSPAARTVLMVAGGAFLVLSLAVALIGALPGDAWTRQAVLAWEPDLVRLMRVVNHGGTWPFLAPAALLLIYFSPSIRAGWWAWGIAFVLAPVIEGTAKFLVGRSRPEGLAYGFPSGHAAAAAVYFAAVWYAAGDLSPHLRRIVRTAAAVAIALVALARIVLRAHWPSDALGGIALGIACAAAAALISASTRRSRAAPTIPVAPSRG